MTEDTRLDSLKERVENLERAIDERSTDSVFARCYAVVTTLMIVLTFVPLARNELIIWDADGPGYGPEWTLLFMVPLLFLLLCATVRPGKSPWIGWWTAGLAAVEAVTWWLTMDGLRYIKPAGYILLVLLLLTVLLGCVHAVHRTRNREERDRTLLG